MRNRISSLLSPLSLVLLVAGFGGVLKPASAQITYTVNAPVSVSTPVSGTVYTFTGLIRNAGSRIGAWRVDLSVTFTGTLPSLDFTAISGSEANANAYAGIPAVGLFINAGGPPTTGFGTAYAYTASATLDAGVPFIISGVRVLGRNPARGAYTGPNSEPPGAPAWPLGSFSFSNFTGTATLTNPTITAGGNSTPMLNVATSVSSASPLQKTSQAYNYDRSTINDPGGDWTPANTRWNVLAPGATIRAAYNYGGRQMANEGSAVTWVIVSRSDMTASLSGLPASVAPGQTVTGTLTCTNAGPSAATSPTCAVTGLPTGATVSCTPNPLPASLPVGGAISCGISYTAPATPVTLTGTTGASNDGNPANNTASGTVAISISDMSAALSGFPSTVTQGATVTGTLTCTNAGPDPAVNATCGATGMPDGATVTCTPTSPQATVAVGASISCAVSYIAPDPLTTPVTVRGATNADNDTVGANNAVDLTIPGSVADMQAALSGFPATVEPGATVTGTATCTNLGPDVAENAVCNVNGLPPGATVSCKPLSPEASLAVNAAITCAVSYTAPSVPVTLVAATNATNDVNLANNSATVDIGLVPKSDMTASLSGLPASVVPGQTVTGTLTCANAGPFAANSPTCVVTGLPAGATVSCTPNPLPAGLPVGGTISCGISYTAPVTPVTLTGTTGASNDGNPANNTASGTVAVSLSDMSAALSGFPSTVIQGATVTGTLTCTNAGPNAAVNATCGASGLPAGATVACTPPSPQASVAVGASISCAVTYVAPDPATSPVTIRGATNADNDTVGANNAVDLTIPGSVADMRAALSGFPATVEPGATVTGTATCTNAGPDAAQNAVCNVSGLPAGATVSCKPLSPQASLAPGAAITCAVTYTAPAGAVTVVGTTSATNDVNLANNSASVVVMPPVRVPTLSAWMQFWLVLLCMVSGAWAMRGRRG